MSRSFRVKAVLVAVLVVTIAVITFSLRFMNVEREDLTTPSTKVAAETRDRRELADEMSREEENGIRNGNKASARNPMEFAKLISKPLKVNGRVVDAKTGKGVSGAEISYSIVSSLEFSAPRRMAGRTDAEGNFEVNGGVGTRLIVYADHTDYYQGSQAKASVVAADVLKPLGQLVDDGAAIQLELIPKGERVELIMHQGTIYFRDAGRPYFFSLRSGGALTEEDGNNVIALSITAEEPRGDERYSWSVLLSARDGSLVPRKDRLEFLAPEEGWIDKMELGFKAKEDRWSWSDTGDFFVKFDDGTYGRISIEVSPKSGRARLKSYYNPNGGRRLEPR